MIVAYLSLTLTGGVTLLRKAKSLSNQDIANRIKDVELNPIKDWGNKKYLHLPISTKDHEVSASQSSCTQRLNITQDQYNAIVRGTVMPSYATMRDNGLLIKGKPDNKRWNQMSPYSKLMLYYTDIASDMGAINHHITFVVD